MRRRRELEKHFEKRGDRWQWGRIPDVKWEQEVPRLNVHEVHVQFQIGRHCPIYQVRFESLGQMSLQEAVARTVPLNRGAILRHIVLGYRNERNQWIRVLFPAGRRWGRDKSPKELRELQQKLEDEERARAFRIRRKRDRRRLRVSLRKRLAGAFLGRSSSHSAHAHA